jgi:Uma2 family endonuclease
MGYRRLSIGGQRGRVSSRFFFRERVKLVSLLGKTPSPVYGSNGTQVDSIIEILGHSPRLPEVFDQLTRKLEAEKERRRKFYEEMTPEQKIEFIDGEVVLHSPARNIHLDVTKRVLRLVDSFVALNKLGEVKFEKCLVVFPRNDYEPDLVFFGAKKTEAFENEKMRFPVPDFVVEVLSKSTEANDRGVKFEEYAANGVAEYWIINTDQGVLEQYLLEGESYQLALKASSGLLRSTVIEGFECDLEALFDEKKNLAAVKSLFE